MPWYAWVVVALYVATMVVNVASVGRPRKALTPLEAAVSLVLNGLILWAIVALAERCP